MTAAQPSIKRAAAQAIGAGTVGGLAMIPVGLALRYGFGVTVNVYGELVVERILGRVVPWALFVEHFLISWALAVPIVWLMSRRPRVSVTIMGLAYGAAIWVLINSLALPFAFDRPTPWEIGWPAIWPSLTVHIVYGIALSHAVARSRRTVGA
jgi:uncharacterized membrane protein YagU involved in acid resistance